MSELERIQGFGKPAMSDWEWQQLIADSQNRIIGRLNEEDQIDCPKCLNRGYTTILKGDPKTDPFPDLAQRECECMARRRIVKNARVSGMGPMLGKKFKDYEVKEEWQKDVKEMAVDFVQNPEGWFAALGQVGSGKTLIASCIANQLLRDGHSLLVKSWPELVRESEVDYFREKEILGKYQKVECLFLDDFLKTKPTDRALGIAFELLDYRYRNGMITIITSEKEPEDIAKLDRALWGRIKESAGRHIAAIAPDCGKDQRHGND